MKHIDESIIGKRGYSPVAGLWTLDLLTPYRGSTRPLTSKQVNNILSIIRTDITYSRKHHNVSDIEPCLRMESNLAGIRGEQQAVAEARKYMEYIKKQGNDDRFFKFIGITRPYGEDEPEPLEWDYVVGLDNHDRVFVLDNK